MRQSVVKLPSVPEFAKRCFFLAAGFLVAAAIVLLGINLYLHSDSVEQRIRDAALRSLGAEVKIRSTMYTPWSGLVLRGISVADPTNANLNIVEARALRVRFSFAPLLKNRFVITECTLFEPKLIVRQLENGDWLIPLAPAPAPTPEGWKEALPSTTEGSSFKAELQQFRLRSGNIVFLNAKNRAIVNLDRADISSQIASNHSATGIFELGEADFFNSLKPRKIGGPFTWDGKVLDFPDIQGSLAGGKLNGNYRIEIGDKPSFVLGLQVSGALLRKLSEEAQLEPGKTEGILQGSVDLRGDPRETQLRERATLSWFPQNSSRWIFSSNWASCSTLTNFNCSS
jgi:uncharacterized protein involved in outer membrane biogenesis